MEMHMTIFRLNILRFPEFLTLRFIRWNRHYASGELEGMSDRGLEDIGIRPARRDFDSVKPFWLP
jgi:uncharacterized protein YjiS (DUF1127 family)